MKRWGFAIVLLVLLRVVLFATYAPNHVATRKDERPFLNEIRELQERGSFELAAGGGHAPFAHLVYAPFIPAGPSLDRTIPDVRFPPPDDRTIRARCISAALYVVSLAVLAMIARHLGGAALAWRTVAVALAIPLFEASQARIYAVYLLTSLATVAGALAWLDHRGAKAWLGLALFGLAGLEAEHSFALGMLYVIVPAVVIGLRGSSRKAWPLVVVALAVCMAALPWTLTWLAAGKSADKYVHPLAELVTPNGRWLPLSIIALAVYLASRALGSTPARAAKRAAVPYLGPVAFTLVGYIQPIGAAWLAWRAGARSLSWLLVAICCALPWIANPADHFGNYVAASVALVAPLVAAGLEAPLPTWPRRLVAAQLAGWTLLTVMMFSP